MEFDSFLKDNPDIEMFNLVLCDLNGMASGKRVKRDAILYTMYESIDKKLTPSKVQKGNTFEIDNQALPNRLIDN